jgi:hypothetical protein
MLLSLLSPPLISIECSKCGWRRGKYIAFTAYWYQSRLGSFANIFVTVSTSNSYRDQVAGRLSIWTPLEHLLAITPFEKWAPKSQFKSNFLQSSDEVSSD